MHVDDTANAIGLVSIILGQVPVLDEEAVIQIHMDVHRPDQRRIWTDGTQDAIGDARKARMDSRSQCKKDTKLESDAGIVNSILDGAPGSSPSFCYSPPMGPVRRFRYVATLIACIAFLSLRLVGDHLHFCFDGSEPLVSVHGDDGAVHHADMGMAASHDDVNVDLMSAVFKGASDLLVPVALMGALLLFLLPLVRMRRIEFSRLLLPDSRYHHLRPPLRGPPR